MRRARTGCGPSAGFLRRAQDERVGVLRGGRTGGGPSTGVLRQAQDERVGVPTGTGSQDERVGVPTGVLRQASFDRASFDRLRTNGWGSRRGSFDGLPSTGSGRTGGGPDGSFDGLPSTGSGRTGPSTGSGRTNGYLQARALEVSNSGRRGSPSRGVSPSGWVRWGRRTLPRRW